MLKLKYLYENYDLAGLALENWPHDDYDLLETLQWFRISSNAVYPYRSGGKMCFLRLSPAEEKRKDDLLDELAHIELLRKHGYPAMEPLQAHNGETLLCLDTPWGAWYASAFAGVSGVQVEDLPHTQTLLHAYGAALGQLHALSARHPVHRRSHEEVLDLIGAMLERYDAPACAKAELSALRDELSALPRTTQTYGAVHYDFEPDNVFYDEETGTCSIIDFEDGMLHWYALDVEQALAELPVQEHAAFIEGYREHFPYTAQTDSMRPLMRRFCVLFAYARLLHTLHDAPAEQPDWMQELCAKLTYRMQELENIIAAHNA